MTNHYINENNYLIELNQSKTQNIEQFQNSIFISEMVKIF